MNDFHWTGKLHSSLEKSIFVLYYAYPDLISNSGDAYSYCVPI